MINSFRQGHYWSHSKSIFQASSLSCIQYMPLVCSYWKFTTDKLKRYHWFTIDTRCLVFLVRCHIEDMSSKTHHNIFISLEIFKNVAHSAFKRRLEFDNHRDIKCKSRRSNYYFLHWSSDKIFGELENYALHIFAQCHLLKFSCTGMEPCKERFYPSTWKWVF